MANTFNMTRTEIVNKVFRKLRVLGRGRVLTAEEMADGVEELELVLKELHTFGLRVWCREDCILFVTPGTAEYALGNGANCALEDDCVMTTLTTAADDADTTITVASVTGMAVSDYIGIVLDDKTTHWTTISAINTGTKVITLTSAISGDDAASANNVYTFTTKITKPLEVRSMWRSDGNLAAETTIQMDPLTHETLRSHSSRVTRGTSIYYSYQPLKTSGVLEIYMTPEDSKQFLRLTTSRMLNDTGSASEYLDIPSEWLQCIIYTVATNLAPDYGKEQLAATVLGPAAQQKLLNAMMWDVEGNTVQFMPGVD